MTDVTAAHLSDCAVHNAPAYPPGPCDCGVQPTGAVADALDRMDALLDPKAGLLTVGYDSATARASRWDMQIIRATIAAQSNSAPQVTPTQRQNAGQNAD